jgi:hypothetical protein
MARDKLDRDLWERNKLDNPTKRDDYEMRQSEVTDKEGNTVIKSELWQKIDEARVQVSINVVSKELKEEKPEVGDLING